MIIDTKNKEAVYLPPAMKSYPLIHQLITLVEQLESENGNKELTILDFAGFLNNSLDKPVAPKQEIKIPL